MTALSAPTFTLINALVTFGKGVLLPSADVYSDIALSAKLLQKSCADYKNNQYLHCYHPDYQQFIERKVRIQNLFGWIMWIPIIINLLFTIPHYLRVEKTWKQRLLTFPLLLCLCWPQYRNIRVLWFAYVRCNIVECLAEKLDLEQNVSNLGKKLSNRISKKLSCHIVPFSEPFLEATPQVYITLILLGQDALDGPVPQLWTSLAFSIISATFGIAKLLKNGPIKMVRKDGKIGGYGTPGFILLMLIVAGNMVGKDFWMEIVLNSTKSTAAWIWALTCLLPQVLLVK